ncbi:MAG TPA: HD domain-containing protein [Bacteroidia bacterium]|nr:HD domain-containing protein [Bacteroidia bacterium]
MFKKKIVNDPIYGFITIPDGIIFQLIEHPWFQRLRRIEQLGVTHLVYPGAIHTRFHHTLGAMHLMHKAIETLRSKGIEITDKEEESAKLAILLHDIGHGPLSHNLEHSIVHHIPHEDMSSIFMEKLNKEFNGQLTLAIKIFRNKHPKKFLHQLVSSQLDVDRLDYLTRDTFFTGVSEGVVGYDRIINMLNVAKGNLVVEAKGIYSIEKFIIARRIMYWQVYLHKTVLSAMELVVNIFTRAKELAANGEELFCTPALKLFIYNNFTKKDFEKNTDLINAFAMLDDHDVMSCIKVWIKHTDFVLSTLCHWLINRRLYSTFLQKEPFSQLKIKQLVKKAKSQYGLNDKDVSYFVFSGEVENAIYKSEARQQAKGHLSSGYINILYPEGKTIDITKASDYPGAGDLDKITRKYFLCYPKELKF